MKLFSIVLSYLIPLFYIGLIYVYYLVFTGKYKSLTSKTTGFLIITALFHLTEIVTRQLILNTMPLSTMHDAFSFLAFSILVVYLIIEISLNNKASGFFVLSLAFLLELISSFNLSWEKETNALLTNFYFTIHASMSIMGYTALSLSAIYALMYIYQNRNLKLKRIGRLSSQFPALTYLEKMSIRSVVIGIILLGLGIFHGHIQANRTFGTYYPVDVKVIVSDLIWLFYLAGYVLSRIMKWRGKWMAWLSVSGFAFLMIIGIMVMFFAESFHRFY